MPESSPSRRFETSDSKTEITPDALNSLINYHWPGNIRELQSITQSAINLSQGDAIAPQHLPPLLTRSTAKRKESAALEIDMLPLADVEKLHILKVYNQTNQNKSEAARVLDISLSTLRRKLEGYGIT